MQREIQREGKKQKDPTTFSGFTAYLKWKTGLELIFGNYTVSSRLKREEQLSLLAHNQHMRWHWGAIHSWHGFRFFPHP